MLDLPSILFNRIATFVPPKSLFASKRVSKLWEARLNNQDLWKDVTKSQHSAIFPMVTDFESTLKSLTKPVDYDDFKFVASIFWDGVEYASFRWQDESAWCETSPDVHAKLMSLVEKVYTPPEPPTRSHDFKL